MTFGVFLQENFIWLPSPMLDSGNITKLYQKKVKIEPLGL
ncbi:hypothetical protein MYAER_4317 [Microcystis aeruginosa NIES-2549]|uniref:Uncharacterized protein n=1 Tax=Microcystis aeruginosa NIES-2549 TaxID=1641812 RepID=A0A0F6U7K7_MICAE|nr:hypothetical protein MYAER_4317 [Microcystis aeruginosa NIES-2549]AOC55041.1 hypothetical protein amyaer_4364 [Microcystis aeruginosa NIES-2481]